MINVKVPEDINFEIVGEKVKIIKSGKHVMTLGGENRWRIIENMYGDNIVES